MNQTLAKEMQSHTYAIMYRVEESHWWYAGRRLILTGFLRETVEKLRSDGTPSSRRQPGASRRDDGVPLRILDVGCGTGANLEMLAQFGDASGVDVSSDALEFCKRRGLTEVKQGLAESLPFDDAEFDLATALDVVEHLDDDLAGLSEMNRVLKPGGRALVFVPAFRFLWGVQDDISHHRRRYTKGQIVAQVEKAGFEVERATYANITFFAPILAGRALMKLTGFRPRSENNLTIGALNGFLGNVFGAERFWLKNFDLPFGVSIVVAAKKIR